MATKNTVSKNMPEVSDDDTCMRCSKQRKQSAEYA